MATFSVILAAAGKSSRFQNPVDKKPFVMLNDKAVWLYSAERFLNRDDVKQLIVVIAKEDQESFLHRFGSFVTANEIDVVVGGAERADSVQNALNAVHANCEFVVIHDAARPCVSDEEIDRLLRVGEESGAAILGTRVSSTVKKSVDGRLIDETIDRSQLWLAQTPQCFSKDLIKNAYANRGEFNPTDEAQLIEREGGKVSMVEGSPTNIKLTTQADMVFAEAFLNAGSVTHFDAPLSDDRQMR